MAENYILAQTTRSLSSTVIQKNINKVIIGTMCSNRNNKCYLISPNTREINTHKTKIIFEDEELNESYGLISF